MRIITFKIFFFCLCLLIVSGIMAQSSEKVFRLNFDKVKFIDHSIYKTIILADHRVEKDFLGFVQVGLLNTPARVITEVSLQKQIDELMSVISTKYAREDTMIMELRHINFAEVTGAFNETGYINFKANIYGKKNNLCYLLDEVDSIFNVKGLDVTNKTLNEGSEKFISMIVKNLKNEVNQSNPPIEYNDLLKLDSIEKSKIPLYANNTYVDGGYRDFNSFKSQMPNDKIRIENDKNGKVKSIYKMPTNTIVVNSSYYAVVYDGKPYICLDKDCYQIYKNKDIFYFVGNASDANRKLQTTAVMYAGFGLIGGVIYASLAGDVSSSYMIVIDHRTGETIPIRKMKNINR